MTGSSTQSTPALSSKLKHGLGVLSSQDPLVVTVFALCCLEGLLASGCPSCFADASERGVSPRLEGGGSACFALALQLKPCPQLSPSPRTDDASIQEAFVKIGKLVAKVLQKSRSCLHTNTKNKRSHLRFAKGKLPKSWSKNKHRSFLEHVRTDRALHTPRTKRPSRTVNCRDDEFSFSKEHPRGYVKVPTQTRS